MLTQQQQQQQQQHFIQFANNLGLFGLCTLVRFETMI